MKNGNCHDAFGEQELVAWLGLAEAHSTTAALAWAVPAVKPAAHLRGRLLARVAEETARPVVAPAMLTVRADEGQWRQKSPGVQVKRLFVDRVNKLVTALYRLAPGATIEAHRHNGFEQSYILEGDCRIGENVYGPGDFQCAPAGSVHDTLSTVNGTLLLIVSPFAYEPLAA